MDLSLLEIRVGLLELILIKTKDQKVVYLAHLKALIETIESQEQPSSDEMLTKLETLYTRIRSQHIEGS